MNLDIKTLRRIARTTYRCPRGCVLGFVVPGANGPALAYRDGKEWRLTDDPLEPIYVVCGHLTGVLRWSDNDAKNVNFSQDAVRTLDPNGQHMSREEAMRIEPLPIETWNTIFGKG